jgi:hypothetical protein
LLETKNKALALLQALAAAELSVAERVGR